MKISVEYGLRSKSNGELYRCEASADHSEEYGVEMFYILEKSGSDGLTWTTSNIADALIVKNTKLNHYYVSLNTPDISKSYLDDIEVVAIYHIDSKITVVSSDGIPQTIYDFISDDDEALTLTAHFFESGKYIFDEAFKKNLVQAYKSNKTSINQHSNVFDYRKIVDICLKEGKLKLPDSKNIVEKELKKQLEKFNN